MRRVLLPLAILALPAACARPSAEEREVASVEAALDAIGSVDSATEAALVREAEAFMQAYAEDLRAGNRAALAARYDPRGAGLSRDGIETELEWSEIERRYASGWQPPASFGWRDLRYETLGPDGVSVEGGFLWGPADGGPPVAYSYSALLVRHDEGLRIRIEDEAALPR